MKTRDLMLFSFVFMSLVINAVFFNVALAPQEVKIFVDPETVTATPGQTFDVDINVMNVRQLYAWQFYLKWDLDVLNLTRIAEGPFLNSSGAYPSFFVPKIDYTAGWVYAADTLMGVAREASPTGNGTLAKVTFRVKTEGISALDVYDTILKNFDGERITHTAEDGYFAYPLAKLSVVPASIINSTIGVGATFSLNVNITDAKSVYDWGLRLRWASDTLNVTAITEGPFLKGNGAYETSFDPQTDEATGSLRVNCTLISEPLGGVNGSGVLVSITFLVEKKGALIIDVYDTGLFERDGTFIPHVITNDGYFDNRVRDISITDVSVSSNTVTVGGSVNIVVTVRNEGDVTESFTVEVFYDTTSIGRKTVTNLASGSSTPQTFEWNTKDVSVGDYTIRAVVSPISGEIDTADNSRNALTTVSVTAGQPPIPAILIVGVVVIIIVVGGALVFFLRRGKGSSKP